MPTKPEDSATPKARPVTAKFRVRYMTTDMVTHVYCHVYAAEAPGRPFESIGLLTLTRQGFEAFRRAFAAEFIDDLRSDELEA